MTELNNVQLAARASHLEAENARLLSELAAQAGVLSRLALKTKAAEFNAWDSLSRYKLLMFGYWAGQWVLLNSITNDRRPNPWTFLVAVARAQGFGPLATTQKTAEA